MSLKFVFFLLSIPNLTGSLKSKKMKKKINVFVAYLVAPILVAVFFADRILTSLMWWSKWNTLGEFFRDAEVIAYTIIRLMIASIVWLILWFVFW